MRFKLLGVSLSRSGQGILLRLLELVEVRGVVREFSSVSGVPTPSLALSACSSELASSESADVEADCLRADRAGVVCVSLMGVSQLSQGSVS